jgi:hypothetical protein
MCPIAKPIFNLLEKNSLLEALSYYLFIAIRCSQQKQKQKRNY